MNRDRYPVYALVVVAGAAVAVWAELPLTFLLVLICPVMMVFMMRGMSGMTDRPRGDVTSGHENPAPRAPSRLHTDSDAGHETKAQPPSLAIREGSHERIDLS